MSELSRLLELVKKIDKKVTALLEKQEDPITEKEAAKFLGITVRALQAYVCTGKMPITTFTVSSLGKRMYFKSKLIQ